MPKTERSPILICTAERTLFRPLITVGSALAKEERRPLSILTVQPRELVTRKTAENIQVLYNAVTGTGAETTVLFSNSPILSFAVFAKQINASRAIIDEGTVNGEISFCTLRDLLADIPLSVLPKKGQLITFPPKYEMHTVM